MKNFKNRNVFSYLILNCSLQHCFQGMEKHEISVSNAIYFHKKVQFLDEFLSTAKEYFYSDVSNVDFSKTLDAVENINSWIRSKTMNKIQTVIEESTSKEYIMNY